jgi:hypothetical protein
MSKKLSVDDYYELQSALDDAEDAAVSGMGGRHAILVMVLNGLGYAVRGLPRRCRRRWARRRRRRRLQRRATGAGRRGRVGRGRDRREPPAQAPERYARNSLIELASLGETLSRPRRQ